MIDKFVFYNVQKLILDVSQAVSEEKKDSLYNKELWFEANAEVIRVFMNFKKFKLCRGNIVISWLLVRF